MMGDFFIIFSLIAHLHILPFFFNKMVFLHRFRFLYVFLLFSHHLSAHMIVVTFMRMWLSSSWCDGWLCFLSTTVSFLSSLCSVYLCLDDSNEQNTYNQRQEIKSMVVSM